MFYTATELFTPSEMANKIIEHDKNKNSLMQKSATFCQVTIFDAF